MKFLFPLVMLVLFSCAFEPEGEFVVKAPEPDVSDVIIDFNLENDTLYIFQSAEFHFTLSYGSRELVGGEISVGDYQITSGYISPDMVFTFYPYSVGSGIHKMKVEYTLSSGTGSLADEAGAEFVTAEKELTLIVDIDPPPAPILSVDSLNGELTIHWDPYTARKFVKYDVIKSKRLYGGWQYYQIESLTITDRNITSWTDEDYIGGEFMYQVLVQGGDQYTLSEGTVVNHTLQTGFRFTGIGTNIEINWTKPAFYKNIRQFEIWGADPGAPVKLVTDFNETTFEEPFPYKFGSGSSYSIFVKSANDYHTLWQTINVYFGTPRPQTFDLSGIEYIGNDQYVTWTNWYAGQFALRDADLNVVHEEVRRINAVASSPDYQLTYFFSEAPDEGIYRLDPETFTGEKILSINELLGPVTIYGNPWPRTVIQYMTVSNNNWVGLQTNGGNYVIDMDTQAVLYSSTSTAPIRLSNEGEYLIDGWSIYKWETDHYALHHSFSSAGQLKFRPDAPGEVLVDEGFHFRKYNLADMSVLSEYTHSLDWRESYSYDPLSKRIVYRKKLINAEDMTEIPFPYYGSDQPVIMNNMLIDTYYFASLESVLMLNP